MAGNRLTREEEEGGGPGQSLSLEGRKRRRIGEFAAAFLAGSVAFFSGSNLNEFGGNTAMAQQGGTTTRRRGAEQPEETRRLEQAAVEAANAFRDYLITGNASFRTQFWSTYNQSFRGATYHDNTTFMHRLYRELEERVGNNSATRPLYDAFVSDRGRLFGFLWSNPAHFTDFIDTVFNIRTLLDGGRATDAQVDTLVRQVREAGGRAVRGDTAVGRVRELMRSGMPVEEAARAELERRSRDEARQRYGERLTDALIQREPATLARRAAIALREFILTGNTARKDEFRRIFDANNYQAFTDAFQTEFRARISRGDNPDLVSLSQAYARTQGGGLDPNQFATAITNIYRAATAETPTELERLRTTHGAEFVDPLLRVVANGMARRAISLMRDVLATGDTAARDAFVAIMNGRLASIVNDRVQVSGVENNEIFWREFTTLYSNELRTNTTFETLANSFGRNILPIAIRDIIAELARTNPDMARLNTDYGGSLVRLVAGSAGTLGWLTRPEGEITSLISSRAQAEDPVAQRLRGMTTSFSKARALPEAYIAMLEDRLVRRELTAQGLLELFEQNFDALSYLSGTPADVQREIERRAGGRTPDATAQRLRTAAGGDYAVITALYSRFARSRSERTRLTTAYSADFLAFVTQNLDNLHWVLRPVEEIDTQLRGHRDDDFVRAVSAREGSSVSMLAQAAREIYTELGRSSPNTAQLERRYGADVVAYIRTNRSNLSWLSGSQAEVERGLQTRTDQHARELTARLYGYNTIQLVSAIARVRGAVARGGLVREDARDAYGTLFIGPVVSRQAPQARSVSPEAAQELRGPLVARSERIAGELESVRSQLRNSILAPARELLSERIRRWEQENNDIVLTANSTRDPQVLEQLRVRQERLFNGMVKGDELRRSVELAFSMIHLAETGAEVSTVALGAGGSTTDVTVGQISRLMAWYNSAEVRDSGKQPIIGEIVGAVIRRADPQLYTFIGGLDERNYFSAVQRTYAVARSRGADTRATLTDLYGAQFVTMIDRLAPSLTVLDNPSATVANLRMGENDLMAAIVARVYRALNSPSPNEDRAAMIALFGERFVLAVENNQAQMGAMGGASAGLAEYNSLPEAVRRAVFGAYSDAYARSVGSLMRSFRRLDERMFYEMDAVRAALEGRPNRERMAELNATYGAEFVQLVQRNLRNLQFLRSPSITFADLPAQMSPELLAQFRTTFANSPGASRSNFMANFAHLSQQLPRVYLQLRSALVLARPTDQIGETFERALREYRTQFGSNDYLFRQYVNLDLLGRSLQRMAQRYNITLPEDMRRRAERNEPLIRTPEDLVTFLRSESGGALIRAGRTFYDNMERDYLRQREQRNFRPQTGDYSDSNVANLRNELSIIDALYMGIALERISGTDTAMSSSATMAVMHAILVIQHRDPYLVGPFILQVLPAILSVAQDERTLQAGLTAFTEVFSQRYGEGTRQLAFSTALNRRYFLEVFQRMGERLPEVSSTYDHNRLEDELRLVPEPRTDDGYLSPLLYRYRPGFWQGEGLEPLPTIYGQQGFPLRLLPRPTMPTNPFLPVPAGSLSIDSGAMGLFTSMYDQLRPPADRMFRQRVPQRFRIGPLGPSTLIRRINELFGPMPVDYSDYWLAHSGEAGGFYSYGGQPGASGGPSSSTQTGGAAGIYTGRTITGGQRSQVGWTRQATEVQGGGGTGATSDSVSTRTDTIDVTSQQARLPEPLTGPVPFPLFSMIPVDVWRRGQVEGYAQRPASEVRSELERRSRAGEQVITGLTRLRPNGTAEALMDVHDELRKTTPDRERLVRQYSREFVEYVESNYNYFTFIEQPTATGGLGIHRARQEFHHQWGGTTATQTQPGGAQLSYDQQTQGRTSGILDSYSRIARDNATDMLVFVAGEHVPELRGPPSATGQRGALQREQEDRLRSRLYFVTREGNIYQLNYGLDTRAQLLNYLYGGANTQQVLAGLRFAGREMAPTIPLTDGEIRSRAVTHLGLTRDVVDGMSIDQIREQARARNLESRVFGGTPAGGFDGAAIGFTVPTSGGDTFSALALGNLVRSMGTMDPVHVEQAVGSAVTNLLASRSHRDIYAAFYRGAQTVTSDPNDRSRITDSRWSEGYGEVMWRRVRAEDVQGYQMELRGVGGYPLTAGARFRYEWRPGRYREAAFGATAAYSQLDLLRQFRAVDSNAGELYSRVNQMLVSLYGWSEDTARDTGWLIAGSYLYARLEDWTVRDPNSPTGYRVDTSRAGPEEHFASLMLMYWAQRHGILVGGQRVPGWNTIYSRIDQAMTMIQQQPGNEAQILSQLSQAIRQDLTSDIWRFALAYGYDGERVRVYTVASATYFPTPRTQVTGAPTDTGTGTTGTTTQTATPDVGYGNLYSLFLFGRPTRFFADILAHAYGMAPLVIAQDSSQASGFSVRYDRPSPWLDLYTGFGYNLPGIAGSREERRVALRRSPDAGAALRDVYTVLGASTWDRTRMTRVYGSDFVSGVESGRESLSWMVRSEADIARELTRRAGEEDAVAMQIGSMRSENPAAAIRDIYIELRKAAPDRERLERLYTRELVALVERQATDLQWMLLPPDQVEAGLRSRSGRAGSAEARIAESRMPEVRAQDQLTGAEVKRMFEQNMRDVVAAATLADSQVGLRPDAYEIILSSRLRSGPGSTVRSGTYYILHSTLAERGNSTASLVIGNEDDLTEWMRNGHEIGRGITRVEIAREGDTYNVTFSGDRRDRWLSAGRAIGGISLPVSGTELNRWAPEGNWTAGGLLQIFQNHRHDILGGLLYGTRQYGNERWDQWTVTVSGRVQATQTVDVSDAHYWYLFFNRTTRQIVVASGDVFQNTDELRNVCREMGGTNCQNLTDLERMTGGAGWTWARTDVVTGDRLSFHLFFEGGAERVSSYAPPGQEGTAVRPRDWTPVARGGLGVEWVRRERSAIPFRLFGNIAGQTGAWPLLPGEVTSPEYLRGWGGTIGGGLPAWWVMANIGVNW
ncbi:MAG: hypothetical protein AB1324_03515 [Candidatus Micrarchaeota archaeon]